MVSMSEPLFSASGKLLPKVFSVSEYIEVLNIFFKKHEHRILGEITSLQRAASGHVYFTLKDKSGAAALDCIIWSRTYQMCGVALEVGMEVILTGKANIYAQSGRFSFVADAVELVGEGALKKQYDALKKKLESEGLFSIDRKRPMPKFPKNIGVITSLKGAVIHDFENNLGKFGLHLKVIDSRVEGQIAVADLLASVATMRKQDVDVLVMIRGGGSLESLQAYNNEALVRATVDFPVPVIAGIGHDQDVPLVALAADFMASTPTATAHLVSRPWEEAYAKINQVAHLVPRVGEAIQRIRRDIAVAQSAVIDHAANQIAVVRERLNFYESTLALHNPERQLKLGYAIIRREGKIIRSIREVKQGDLVSAQLEDGSVDAVVE
jgi:exodeoxyribonuclease VII large subunit